MSLVEQRLRPAKRPETTPLDRVSYEGVNNAPLVQGINLLTIGYPRDEPSERNRLYIEVPLQETNLIGRLREIFLNEHPVEAGGLKHETQNTWSIGPLSSKEIVRSIYALDDILPRGMADQIVEMELKRINLTACDVGLADITVAPPPRDWEYMGYDKPVYYTEVKIPRSHSAINGMIEDGQLAYVEEKNTTLLTTHILVSHDQERIAALLSKNGLEAHAMRMSNGTYEVYAMASAVQVAEVLKKEKLLPSFIAEDIYQAKERYLKAQAEVVAMLAPVFKAPKP